MLTNRQIVEILKKAKKIAIFAHRDPDPDACGCMFGLREFCRALGKDATVFAKKTKPKYLHHIFPLDEARDDFIADDFDLVILADIHALNRIEPIFQNELKKAKNIAIVDHHQISEAEGVASKKYRIKDVASCSQMVVELFETEKIVPTRKAATYLYAGIMGDTDRFLHNNLSDEVFEKAMFLQKCGAEIQYVYDYLYRSTTQEQIRVNKFFLDNLKFIEGGKVAYVVFTQKDVKKLGADMEDVKSFANKITTIEGVEASFLCYEREKGRFKISLRSVERPTFGVEMRSKAVDCGKFASNMGGGGHRCSAAFEVGVSVRELKKKIPLWAKEILND